MQIHTTNSVFRTCQIRARLWLVFCIVGFTSFEVMANKPSNALKVTISHLPGLAQDYGLPEILAGERERDFRLIGTEGSVESTGEASWIRLSLDFGSLWQDRVFYLHGLPIIASEYMYVLNPNGSYYPLKLDSLARLSAMSGDDRGRALLQPSAGSLTVFLRAPTSSILTEAISLNELGPVEAFFRLNLNTSVRAILIALVLVVLFYSSAAMARASVLCKSLLKHKPQSY